MTADKSQITVWKAIADERQVEIDALRALVREMYRPACIYEGAGCEDLGKEHPEVLARALAI